ncbi:hypothetical protein BRAS3843_900048 [Bradyrhizobium sp. STM 3843]|nr:hypothetical protein BRAS3843_900048 [Bradyrhizobium sp. STM 3843]
MLVTTMPDSSMMKPEPSELVRRGVRSPPPLPPGPRRFLKKSSKNSSNGEPGGNCGAAPRPSPPLASTVWEVEMLTTASITFSATSAMPSGPRADAGADTSAPATAKQAAVRIGRKRWLKARVDVIGVDLQKGAKYGNQTAPEPGSYASASGRRSGFVIEDNLIRQNRAASASQWRGCTDRS